MTRHTFSQITFYKTRSKMQVKALMEKLVVKLEQSYSKVPEIKHMMAGNFLDMVERGHIKYDPDDEEDEEEEEKKEE